MKALSLWQPWASFIAVGVKPFETRHWHPPRWLIGQRIAIHAAKKSVSADDREWAIRCGVIGDLPLGAVVCTALLSGAYQCAADGLMGMMEGSVKRSFLDRIPDDGFGDYSAGRWAWLLTEIEHYDPAIPARGAQGLWDWRA